ncbi:hypothetical protein [Kitasatospora phosalacinea]|uniref:hypothetical protein n=1 Tax=Kitasatospora phosalacinea TaxID=2065 RepID=UPI001FD76CE9|nr:hypothetical protein [Kitasatospora phosalacinea]
MTLLAASSSPALPLSVVAVLAALAALSGYALLCAVSPFARCKPCEGNGKTRKRGTSPKRGWKTCRRCKGNGLRLRIGRRLFHTTRATGEATRRLHKAGTR